MPSLNYDTVHKSANVRHDDRLHQILESLYKKYNRFELIKPDPLQFVYRFDKPADMEIAGFLAAALAYGRVEQIQRSVDNLLARMGNNPFDFVINFKSSSAKSLIGFKHRFNTADDICDLCSILKNILRKYESLENCFAVHLKPDDADIINALSGFVNTLLRQIKTVSKGLNYLLSNPANGSPCKRLNMFLRWMVRDDDVDAGLWKSINKSLLIVPIDTHMTRLCKILGLYERKTVSLTTAVEITNNFAKLEPDDPVKYDFAISRIGIIEDCTGRYRPKCEDCEVIEFCKRRDSF